MAGEDWDVENFFLSNDPRKSYFGPEEQSVSEKIGDSSPKIDETIWKFVKPSNEEDEIEDDELPFRWSVQKQRGSKGK